MEGTTATKTEIAYSDTNVEEWMARLVARQTCARKEGRSLRALVRTLEGMEPHARSAAIRYLADRYLGVKLWRS